MNPTLAVSVYIFLVSASLGLSLKLHGDTCLKRKDCDVSSGLTCLNNTCQCSRPESTVYSDTLKACVIRIGRRCDEFNKNNGTHEFSTSSSSSSSSNLQMTCIENAECKKLRARHWCQCKDGYMPNTQGTECKGISKYGEFCDEDEDQCDKATGTQCIDGNCQCPFAEQYFDQHEGVCKSLAGGKCLTPKVSHCVPHAECTSANVRMGYMTEKGVKKIHTKSVTQCLCKSGYSQTSNGYCFGSFGTICNSKSPCNSEDFLSCVDGQCKCRNPLHEKLNESTGQCESLVNTPCTPGGPVCVENSECVDGHCQCVNGYTATPSRTCKLGYKQTCQANQCNGFTGLACVKGRCDCFDSYLFYDMTKQACVVVEISTDE